MVDSMSITWKSGEKEVVTQIVSFAFEQWNFEEESFEHRCRSEVSSKSHAKHISSGSG